MTNTPINEETLDKMKVAVSEVISETTYTCSRVWEAWHYGTMTDEDFEPAWENDTLLTEVVEAVLAAAQPVVNSVEELDALPHGSVILNSLEEAVSKYGDDWYFPGINHRFTRVVSLPARVLHRPEVQGA